MQNIDIDAIYDDILKRCNVNQENGNKRPEREYGRINQQYGEGVGFQRLRRITGYLTGDINTWNNGKKAELADREKHDADT